MWNPFEVFERDKVWREHFEKARVKSEHDDPGSPHNPNGCPYCARENTAAPELTSEMIETE